MNYDILTGALAPAIPDYQGDVRAFHEALAPDNNAESLGIPDHELKELRIILMEEELAELVEALYDNDIVAVADAIGDLLYVTFGTALACGIDMAPVWKEIQRSNMKKAGGERRADGKVLKPADWTPPDIRGALGL